MMHNLVLITLNWLFKNLGRYNADLAPPPTCVSGRGPRRSSSLGRPRGSSATPTCVSGRGLELGLPHPREARHLELDGWGWARRTKGARASTVWSFVRTALHVQSHRSVRKDAEPFRVPAAAKFSPYATGSLGCGWDKESTANGINNPLRTA